MPYINANGKKLSEPLELDAFHSAQAQGVKLRISSYSYPGGTSFRGSMRAGLCFVKRGSCEYTFRDERVFSIGAGEYQALPQGEYDFVVTSDCDVEITKVWDLSFIDGMN